MNLKTIHFCLDKAIKIFCCLIFFYVIPNSAYGKQNEYSCRKDISYLTENEEDEYRIERCKLDIYYPSSEKDFPTLIWFHGGALETGNKNLLEEFRNQGFAVVDVNYRLSPKAKCPAYIEDVAEAIAWVFHHIAEYGGSAEKIYVGGYSAGGYLALMVTLDKQYLSKYNIDSDRIVKTYSISGHTTTPPAIKGEMGLSRNVPLINEFAPCNNVRQTGTPLMIIVGDEEMEQPARYEENLYFYTVLKNANYPIEMYQLKGFSHITIINPGAYMIREDIKSQNGFINKARKDMQPLINNGTKL